MELEANDTVVKSATQTHTFNAELNKGGHKNVRDRVAKQAILYNCSLEERIDGCNKPIVQSVPMTSVSL